MQITDDAIQLSNLDTLKHIHSVRALLVKVIEELDKRARDHDSSKLQSPEQEIFGKNYTKLGQTEYGSPEYARLLEETKPAIEHHYANNRHHPEHWPNGIEDMTLIDLIEMLCDWKAATARNKNGNIRKSIEVNTTRFKMSPQLRRIMENTVRELFKD